MMTSDSDSSIMDVAELIDNVFGSWKVNVVDHKLLHVVLYLLARQLKVLDRLVEIDIVTYQGMAKFLSGFKVTDVKLLGYIKKKDQKRAVRKEEETTSDDSGPRLSFVTQEQFQELAETVRRLKETFSPDEEPENSATSIILQNRRKQTSLSDPMAALQISARLELSERIIDKLLPILTELANNIPQIDSLEDDIDVIFKEGNLEEEMEMFNDRVTYEEMEMALGLIHDEVIKAVEVETWRSTAQSKDAVIKSLKLEKHAEKFTYEKEMEKLEKTFAEYAERMNAIDTALGVQMEIYQDELSQMQYELETGLVAFDEALAKPNTASPTAIVELNEQFSKMQPEITKVTSMLNETRKNQNNFSTDIDELRRKLESILAVKFDRQDLVQALDPKVGIHLLNSFVPFPNFQAVQGDLEKSISKAYGVFNFKELTWQHHIEEIMMDITVKKADKVELEDLRNQMKVHLASVKNKVHSIIDIIGEPNIKAQTKKIKQNTVCFSCGRLEPSGTSTWPDRRLPLKLGNETPKSTFMEHGSYGDCIPGYPIPHPKDPRSYFCHRWCGDSHTVVKNNARPILPGLTIVRLNVTVSEDEKMYAVDEPRSRLPCSRCSVPVPSPTPTIG